VSVSVRRVSVDVAAHEECAAPIDAAPKALARWLLESGAQVEDGPHCGGVAGWIDPDGHADYVYPEITGYYLQWLAWTATREGTAVGLEYHAALAQRWLAKWVRCTDPPATRVYLHGRRIDWRNGALFFFDLAMVLRGVASAARAQLIDPDVTLIRDIDARLSCLIADDGMFNPCLANPASATPPDRWSTRRGGYLAKAAAGVLTASEGLAQVGASVRNAAAATITASLDAAIGQPHDETHPALYAIEGALAHPDRRAVATLLPALTNQVDMLLTHAAAHDGALPELHDAPGVDRLDIVAQALRAAVLLRLRCVDWSPDPHALEKMRHRLVHYITPSGSLPFAPCAVPPQYSVWCAMFAEQALQLSTPASLQARRYDVDTYLV
jgi:hypothetical protein